MKKLFSYLLFVILFLGITSCSGMEGLMRDFEDRSDEQSGDSGEKLELRVASYNIRMQTSNDQGARAWENRKQWVRHIFDTYAMDIVGTQEGNIAQLEDIVRDKSLGYVAVGRDDGAEAGETCGIVYRMDKYSVEDSGTFWFSQTPDAPSFGWDANIRRICTWVRFAERETGRSFFVFNAHYDHQGAVARLESSKMMLSKIREIAGTAPTIMTGDLNARPESDPIQELVQSGLLWDSREITRSPAEGPVGTSYGYDLSLTPTSRIDYVLVSQTIHVAQYQVIDHDLITGNIASDHLPVLAKLEF